MTDIQSNIRRGAAGWLFIYMPVPPELRGAFNGQRELVKDLGTTKLSQAVLRREATLAHFQHVIAEKRRELSKVEILSSQT